MSSKLHFQISGPTDSPLAVYLPGVHGDWTSFGFARPQLAARLRIIEIAYPRDVAWNITHYAEEVSRLLDDLKMSAVHLLAESFGSLIAWQIALNFPERIRSIVLIGGFSHPPCIKRIQVAKSILASIPTPGLEFGINAYVLLEKLKGRERACVSFDKPFPVMRGDVGRRAAVKRMHIIADADYRGMLYKITQPIRYIGGAFDLIVPVRRELRILQKVFNERGQFEGKLLPYAPHMILVSHPYETTTQILEWISGISGTRI